MPNTQQQEEAAKEFIDQIQQDSMLWLNVWNALDTRINDPDDPGTIGGMFSTEYEITVKNQDGDDVTLWASINEDLIGDHAADIKLYAQEPGFFHFGGPDLEGRFSATNNPSFPPGLIDDDAQRAEHVARQEEYVAQQEAAAHEAALDDNTRTFREIDGQVMEDMEARQQEIQEREEQHADALAENTRAFRDIDNQLMEGLEDSQTPATTSANPHAPAAEEVAAAEIPIPTPKPEQVPSDDNSYAIGSEHLNTHTVVEDETVWSIARDTLKDQHGIDNPSVAQIQNGIDHIAAANDLNEASVNLIYPGTELNIPGDLTRAAAQELDHALVDKNAAELAEKGAGAYAQEHDIVHNGIDVAALSPGFDAAVTIGRPDAIVTPSELGVSSLSAMAEKFYGDPNAYVALAEYNGIDDPDRIGADQVFKIPEHLESPDGDSDDYTRTTALDDRFGGSAIDPTHVTADVGEDLQLATPMA